MKQNNKVNRKWAKSLEEARDIFEAITGFQYKYKPDKCPFEIFRVNDRFFVGTYREWINL